MCITVHPHQLTDISKRCILHKIPSSLWIRFTKLPLEVTKTLFSGGGSFFGVSVLKDCQFLSSDIWYNICSHTIVCYRHITKTSTHITSCADGCKASSYLSWTTYFCGWEMLPETRQIIYLLTTGLWHYIN